MKNKEIIITTTNDIKGATIQKYLGVICSNIVIGANIFSDIAASFTDFFGGKSQSYQKKLDLLYQEVSKDLQSKAKSLGGNAVLGFKIDYDEISGGGKSMFMVSASGTACLIQLEDNLGNKDFNKSIHISRDEMNEQIQKNYIYSLIASEKVGVNERNIEYLIDNPPIEILNGLLKRYITCMHLPGSYEEEMTNIENIISNIERNYVYEVLYDKITEDETAIINIIKNKNLFNPGKVLSLCKEGNISLTISLLECDMEVYSTDDINKMKEIYTILTSLPDTGKIEFVKGGLLGKDSEKFICQNGHKSPKDSEYCENNNCGVNMKGLTENQVKTIERLKIKIDTLSEMINNQ